MVKAQVTSAMKEKIESKKEKLEKKLTQAQMKRESILEQVKTTAILSAKKKQVHPAEGADAPAALL